MQTIDISQSLEIYSVSRLNSEARFILEKSFPVIWVDGEISNFAAPSSGHWYFSLKDASAQVRCAMFRPQNRRLGFIARDGMNVLIKARVSLYEGRGDFQLLIEHMEDSGEGKLRQQFEELKKRLSAAGLFDTAHKKELPLFPKNIGVVTSPTGAAIRDILTILKRRYPCASVIIYPTLVQGEYAAPNIVKAIEIANQRNECDVLILARGGGSLEDLWPFNEEKVAFAIYQSQLPIISGVGHEIDFTIADFVADVRAATPSAAAELVVPNAEELLESIHQEYRHLTRLMVQKFQQLQQNLKWLNKNLQQQHPKRKLTEQTQFLDRSEETFLYLQNKLLHAYQSKIQTLNAKLLGVTPKHTIRDLHHQLNHFINSLQNSIVNTLQIRQQGFSTLAGKLDALSPLATLQRGFAIATLDKNQQILLRATDANKGDKIQVRLMEGTIKCEIL